MSKQSDELRRYFQRNAIAVKDVAEALGVKPCSVSNILSGREPIGKKRAEKLAEKYGLNPVFLITGEGDLLYRECCQVVERSTISGSAVQSPGATVHAEADAALLAENERLRDEVRFLRSLLMKQE